ncbi:hypothetical protein OG921_26215 [Aldersonia sp. NBC_00410]|uniref:hypothetical protein n=1 Tax=Aldersonia sp. NBC_00410 TaxID=2975954 RepID=UPI0022595EE7|nr:hypothetical protein [Aldersonia sp. NBC_00410]MCX5046674.1 hypothetical protein [Aldersonia sp. NBC_00410]
MKRSIFVRGVFAAAAVGSIALAGAGLAQAAPDNYFHHGYHELTVDLGVEGQHVMVQDDE